MGKLTVAKVRKAKPGIGKDGQPIAFYASGTAPDSEELKKAIEAALAAAAPAVPSAPATPAAPASPAPPKSGA